MSHTTQKSPVCLNCGHQFNGPDSYCPECGQKNGSLNLPFKHLVEEFVEGFLHLDVRLLSTAKYLLSKPGLLTTEFNEGRRVKFVQPVRIYVFISFLFFFMLNFVSVSHEETEQPNNEVKTNVMKISLSGMPDVDLSKLTKAQTDSVINARMGKSPSFEKLLAKQIAKVVNGGKNEYIHSLIKQSSYAMFVLMPLFALLVYLFNRKSFFIHALIFSVHFHSFLFLLLTVWLVINSFYQSLFLFMIVLILGFIYLTISMRKVYPQGRVRALLKSIAVVLMYDVLMTGALLFTAFLALILS